MSKKSLAGEIKEPSKVKGFFIDLIKDILFSIAVVAMVAAVLYAYSGIWPPMVSVDGRSMLPNMIQGDLIIIRSVDKAGIVAYNDATGNGYMMFNNYGDVIVYRPMGDVSHTPVIHRAMYWVEEGEPMWNDGPPAPHSGYITQGDNNYLYDQSSTISPGQPVKKEWIIGVSQFRLPYLGMIKSKLG
jgi:signal peptidase